jgi:hypothetical protein
MKNIKNLWDSLNDWVLEVKEKSVSRVTHRIYFECLVLASKRDHKKESMFKNKDSS